MLLAGNICCGQQVSGNLGNTAVTLGATEGPPDGLDALSDAGAGESSGELSPGPEPPGLGGRLTPMLFTITMGVFNA